MKSRDNIFFIYIYFKYVGLGKLCMKQKNERNRWLPIAVLGYMILAIGWWAILLYRKISENFLLISDSITDVQELEKLCDQYQRDIWMIVGEGLVFIIILGIGLFLIYRSYRVEIQQKLQKKNFLLSVTHELKSPLAGIKLAFQTLLKHDLPRNKRLELYQSGLEENERLNHLVNNLLLATKIEQNYFQNRELIQVKEEIMNILSTFKNKFPEVQFELIAEHEHSVEFDRLGFKSVIDNLLENAIKYSGNDKKVMINIQGTGDLVQINIADNGIGISDNEKNKVFERFYRVGSEDTRQSTGTGLGLYIVKRILEEHHSSIQISDNKPSGTNMKLEIPIKHV